MEEIKTISHKDFKIEDEDINKISENQSELTRKLDLFCDNFDQMKINEIILWKVNRYALLDEKTFNNLNSIKPDVRVIDISIKKKY